MGTSGYTAEPGPNDAANTIARSSVSMSPCRFPTYATDLACAIRRPPYRDARTRWSTSSPNVLHRREVAADHLKRPLWRMLLHTVIHPQEERGKLSLP